MRLKILSMRIEGENIGYGSPTNDKLHQPFRGIHSLHSLNTYFIK